MQKPYFFPIFLILALFLLFQQPTRSISGPKFNFPSIVISTPSLTWSKKELKLDPKSGLKLQSPTKDLKNHEAQESQTDIKNREAAFEEGSTSQTAEINATTAGRSVNRSFL